MKYGSTEWYLYHSYKNENALPWVIILSAFGIFCKGGLAFCIVLWIVYAIYCKHNNHMLDIDPETIKQRQLVNEIKEKYKF